MILYCLGSGVQNDLPNLSLITPYLPLMALDAANCATPPFYIFLKIIRHLNRSCSFSQVTNIELWERSYPKDFFLWINTSFLCNALEHWASFYLPLFILAIRAALIWEASLVSCSPELSQLAPSALLRLGPWFPGQLEARAVPSRWDPAGCVVPAGLSSSSSAPPAQLSSARLPARSPRSPSPSLMTGSTGCLQNGCLQLGELVWVAVWWVLELPCSSNIPGVIFSN